MIIECTACKKKFSVPDGAITANGRLVQCSSCGNKWTQYPIQAKKTTPKIPSIKKSVSNKNIVKKKKGPIPYSKEYMEQKWGSTIQNYAVEKGIAKKESKKINIKKNKSTITKEISKPSFGFFNFLLCLIILSIFFVGILDLTRNAVSNVFPILGPYIDYFFETLENFKIFILDFYK